MARHQGGLPIRNEDLKVPSALIERALRERTDLLSMSFHPEDGIQTEPDASVALLELRHVVCVPRCACNPQDCRKRWALP